MNTECQEPCCVEKRMVTIPLGYNCDIDNALKNIKFESHVTTGDTNIECARRFNVWMRKNVTGEFYAELLKAINKSESEYYGR